MNHGSCRFGLWNVAVDYDRFIIYRVRFVRSAVEGTVPVQFTKFLAGRSFDFRPLISAALNDGEIYSNIYREVSLIPYGETRTYSEIADVCSTHARVVGNAMARNPTPLIIPCHRVVGKNGIGGYSPDISIKISLLEMENKFKGNLLKN